MAKGWKIARIIARPYTGTAGKFKFINSERKDFAVKPPKKSILDELIEKGIEKKVIICSSFKDNFIFVSPFQLNACG